MIVSWYGIRKYPFDDPCRIAGHNCHSRNILCHHTTGSHLYRSHTFSYISSKSPTPCVHLSLSTRARLQDSGRLDGSLQRLILSSLVSPVHTYNLIKYSLHKLQYKSFQYQNIALPLRKNIIMARLMILIINVNNEDQICLTDILKSQRCFLFSIS